MTKGRFVYLLTFIKKQREKQDSFINCLENLCSGNYCDCFLFSEYEDELVNIIKEEMNDKNDLIGWWIYETDFGKDKSMTSIENAEQLYDELKKQ